MATLVNRLYGNFRGVDFANDLPELTRSDDACNMWINYQKGQGVETRPGETFLGKIADGNIYGLFFYRINDDNSQILVHCGTKLYLWNNFDACFSTTNNTKTTPNLTVLKDGMNIENSQAFVFNNILFIKDGINYLEYDGATCKDVVPTIPITSIGKKPTGEIYSDDYKDTVYQDVNLLTGLRKNGFVADGTSTKFYLDIGSLDAKSVYICTAVVNDGSTLVEDVDFTVDRTNGIVTFNTAPAVPNEDGESNVFITFSKTGTDYKNRILHCNKLVEFDNRIFFTGNPDYPNTVFHSELEDPRYIRDTAYYLVGLDVAPIKQLVAGNGILWIFKEQIQTNSKVYYMTPTIDNTYGKVYPVVSGNIEKGCVSTAVNFNDDICFFSANGMEAIAEKLGNDQILQHRSTLVDPKLLSDIDAYKYLSLCEYRGYLLLLVGNNIFLADGRQMYERTNNKPEYEWFYWEMNNNPTYIVNINDQLFLGTIDGKIYYVNDEQSIDGDTVFTSWWSTAKDCFKYEAYTKITNKRGGIANFELTSTEPIIVRAITNKKSDQVGVFTWHDDATKQGYGVYRIKEKKFKWLKIMFSCNGKFRLYSCTAEAYIGGYLKR